MPGEANELLAMLLERSPIACGCVLAWHLGRAIVEDVLRPALRSVGACWSARIEARWMPRDRPQQHLEADRTGVD